MDNKFFTFMGRLADLCILNLLCLICCIPIVTAGASITAMYYVTLKMVRNEEAYIVRSFFRSFRQNLKQSLIIHIIMLVAAFLLISDIYIVRQMSGSFYIVLQYIFIVFSLLYIMMALYLYPVLSKFYNTIKNTFINAFLMSLRHLPSTFLMLVLTLLPIGILFIPSANVSTLLLTLMLLLGFAVIAYFKSILLVKIFDKYIPNEEEDSNGTDEYHLDEQEIDKQNIAEQETL
jgi:uncharacterized membrane protein YesL